MAGMATLGATVGPDRTPQLLDPFAPPASVEETVQIERSGLWARLGALAAVVVVGLGAWALFRPSEAEVGPQPDDEAAAEVDADDGSDDADGGDPDEDEAEEAEPTTTAEPTTSVPGADNGAADGGAEDGDDEDGDDEAEPTGPVVGELTGMVVAVGRYDRTSVQLLDLDTGELREVERARGEPVGAMGATLIFRTDSGIPRMLDLLDPEASIVSPRIGTGGWAEVLDIEEDRVWLMEDDADGLAYRAYDRNGERVDEVDLSGVGSGYNYFSLMVPSAGLIQHPSGGLYQRRGDDFRLVAPGRALAVGDELALMERCDERLSCRVGWFDLETGEPHEGLSTPPELEGDGFYRLVGRDRWLVSFEWRTGQGRLIDVATGEVVREMEPTMGSYGPFGPGPGTISEDGRWMLVPSGRNMVILDLDTGTEWPTELSGDWQGVFIDWPG